MYRTRYQVVPINEAACEDLQVIGGSAPVVLVVDDEPNVANSLATILSRIGFEARAAYSGRSAMMLAQERRPAVLISDIFMPGMDGVQLAIEMVESFPECKVTLFSGHATQRELAKAREAGYEFPLLIKPVHPEKIIEHIWMRLRERSEFDAELQVSA
jgi:DNA-binding NtrC family response regulator